MITQKELCGTETWLYTELTFSPKCKEPYGNILEQLITEGWEVHEKWNFEEISNDMAIYNPNYNGKITLKRKFNIYNQ